MITNKQWKFIVFLKERTAHGNSKWKSKNKQIREEEIKDYFLILKQMSQTNIKNYMDSLITKMKKKYPTWKPTFKISIKR